MKIVTSIEKQPTQRFIYAGNAYVLKGDNLYKEIYFSGDNQLNGLFKKLFKFVGKVVKSPVVGIALTAASGGAFGALSASQLMAVNVAKGVTGIAGLVNTRNELKKQAAADKANQAYYDAQIKLVDDQIRATGNPIPADPTTATPTTPAPLPVAASPEGTKAIQAYAAYINAGGDPATFSLNKTSEKTPNVTSFGLTPSLMIAGGVGLFGVIIIATSLGRR